MILPPQTSSTNKCKCFLLKDAVHIRAVHVESALIFKYTDPPLGGEHLKTNYPGVDNGAFHHSCLGTCADLSVGIMVWIDAHMIDENCLYGQSSGPLSGLDKYVLLINRAQREWLNHVLTSLYLFTIVFSLLQAAKVLLGSCYRTVCKYRALASEQRP